MAAGRGASRVHLQLHRSRGGGRQPHRRGSAGPEGDGQAGKRGQGRAGGPGLQRRRGHHRRRQERQGVQEARGRRERQNALQVQSPGETQGADPQQVRRGPRVRRGGEDRLVTSFETVIGLEVHAHLLTETKIFCGCPTRFGAPPNTNVCPVCLGMPGSLPVLNRRAVELAVRAALAAGCRVNERSIFARKNYFYPDLPKGYQISQYEQPLAEGGTVPIEMEQPDGIERVKQVALLRIHMEEDAGKLVHPEGAEAAGGSYVDFNRSGVPLIEIVSTPDLASSQEAHAYLTRLRAMLIFLDVCDGNMEEGSLRCDANVSLRPRGSTKLGTRVEIKNLNSFRNVARALEYEIERQRMLLERGEPVVQETRLFDADLGLTQPMRGKEEAMDYRYFPEPDLPPVEVDPAWIAVVREELPELPQARRRRFIDQHGLAPRDASLLTLDKALADFYEQAPVASGNPRAAANWVISELTAPQI